MSTTHRIQTPKFAVHIDDYGTEQVVMYCKVDGEERQYVIATREPEGSELARQAKEYAIELLQQKLGREKARAAIDAAEQREGWRVWKRYYYQSSNIFLSYKLSDDINEWLGTGTWPKE